jgi:hypothetical protein
VAYFGCIAVPGGSFEVLAPAEPPFFALPVSSAPPRWNRATTGVFGTRRSSAGLVRGYRGCGYEKARGCGRHGRRDYDHGRDGRRLGSRRQSRPPIVVACRPVLMALGRLHSR